MGYTRTYMSLAVLIGINIAVRVLNINVSQNLLIGNHLVEAAFAMTLVSLLIDLRVINSDIRTNYLKVGLIALFGGVIMVSASFSSLFMWGEFVEITAVWFKIAPFIIFGIGVPSLYFADKLSQKNKIFGFENVGKRGIINIVIIGIIYSILALHLMIKYNILRL